MPARVGCPAVVPMDEPVLVCGTYRIDLSAPRVVGIVNITSDSFSDGGRYLLAEAAIAHAFRLIEEGADIIDIGAESSRPGATPLAAEEELSRLLPVLKAVRDAGVPISVDTYKPGVMQAVLDQGASMINDIWGLRQVGAIDVVSRYDCAVCIMHMQGEPQTMQQDPHYSDVVSEVGDFLRDRVAVLVAAGIERRRIVIDPGFGFGKTVEQNFFLLREFESFLAVGTALLAGISRKSMLGVVTGKSVHERAGASVAAAILAAARGARLLRVHDVALTVDALKTWQMVENSGSEAQYLTERNALNS